LPVVESKLKKISFRLQSQYFAFIDTFQHRCLRSFCLTSSERIVTGFSLDYAGLLLRPPVTTRFTTHFRFFLTLPPQAVVVLQRLC
jgi:hypothetical protein